MRPTGRAQQAVSVECPTCGAAETLEIPEDVDGREAVVSGHRALFGDFTEAECSAGHRFFVYYC